jgi:hypothetical protein
MNDQELKAFKELMSFAERNTCTHDETHRGGAIWEICDHCGMRWADDKGGKPVNAHEYPKEIKDAQTLLLNQNKPTYKVEENIKFSISDLKVQLEKKKAELAKVRDDISELQSEVESYLYNIDDVTDLMSQAIDSLSELV